LKKVTKWIDNTNEKTQEHEH
jgi:chromosome segregation ATPase